MIRENTWKDSFEYTNPMDVRTEDMLNYIDFDFKSIMDCGCGNRTLEKLILSKFNSKNIKYYSVYLYKRGNKTFIRDFNNDEFLNKKVDIIFMSGILEYIYNVPNFLTKCARYGKHLMLGYGCNDYIKHPAPIIINNYTIDEIIKIGNYCNFNLLKQKRSVLKEAHLFYFRSNYNNLLDNNSVKELC